jgi:hypothetical protein
MSCVICSKSGNKLCGGCRNINYCSKECLIKDWKNGHKHTCAALPKAMVDIRLQYSDGPDDTFIIKSPGFLSTGESITNVLNKYTGQTIKLNSSTLLQLLAYCNNILPDGQKDIPVLLGSGMLYVSALINKINKSDKTTDKFYVYKPKSMFVTKIAIKYGCEPIWLYGPDKNNMFLSITKNTINPVRKSIQFWRNEYITTVLSKISELGENSTELSVIYKMNSFDELELTLVRDI